jgi:hypothetical protein
MMCVMVCKLDKVFFVYFYPHHPRTLRGAPLTPGVSVHSKPHVQHYTYASY